MDKKTSLQIDGKVDEYIDKHAVLYRRLYTKREIIAEAVAGRQMPPKSTRHMIPNRIIRLNLPLGWLSEPPEVAIRRYTEPVIVLY